MSEVELNDLAKRLKRRAVDINSAHAHSDEERAVRRSMVVIFAELAEMMLECEKAEVKVTAV